MSGEFEAVFQRIKERAVAAKFIADQPKPRKHKTHCLRGHARTPENLYDRSCRECHRIQQREYYRLVIKPRKAAR